MWNRKQAYKQGELLAATLAKKKGLDAPSIISSSSSSVGSSADGLPKLSSSTVPKSLLLPTPNCHVLPGHKAFTFLCTIKDAIQEYTERDEDLTEKIASQKDLAKSLATKWVPFYA